MVECGPSTYTTTKQQQEKIASSFDLRTCWVGKKVSRQSSKQAASDWRRRRRRRDGFYFSCDDDYFLS